MSIEQQAAMASTATANGKTNANQQQDFEDTKSIPKDGIVKNATISPAAGTAAPSSGAQEADGLSNTFSPHLVVLSSKQTAIAITWAILSLAYLLFLIPLFIVMTNSAAIRVSLCTAMPVPPVFGLLTMVYWFAKHRNKDVSPGFLFRYIFIGAVVLNTIVMIALTIVGFVTDQTSGGVYGRGNTRDVNQRMTMGLFLFGLGYEVVGIVMLVVERRARRKYMVAIGQENAGKVCWC